jgi:hypothetical protein
MAFQRGWLSVLILASSCEASGHRIDDRPQVDRILGDTRYEWVTIATRNTRIHFPVGSYAQGVQSMLRDRAEASRASVLSRLSISDYQEKLDLFYVDSRDDMANLTGDPVAGFSYHDDRAVVLVLNEHWRAFERHESTHVVTLGSWPPAAGAAVIEGLATFVDGDCGGYANGRVARAILDLGALLPLETLAGDFRKQDDLIAYLQAASIVEFMVHREGPRVVAALWRQGLQASPTLLHVSGEAFQNEFESWLSSSYEPVPVAAMQTIRDAGCGVDARPAGQAPQ